MPKMKFLKTLIFPRALEKLQNRVNFSFISYLKFFCFTILTKLTFTVGVNLIKWRIKGNKEIKVEKKYDDNLSLVSSVLLRKLRLRQENCFLIKKTCIFYIKSTLFVKFHKLLMTKLYSITCFCICRVSYRLTRLVYRSNVKPCSASIYLFKVNNRNTRKRCETCSKLTIKTTERRQWSCSGVFIVNFEYIWHLFLLFLLLTLNK